MSSASTAPPPRWIHPVVWSVAIVLTVTGIVVAVVISSWLPLIGIVGGLALPMFPLAALMTGRARCTVTTR